MMIRKIGILLLCTLIGCGKEEGAILVSSPAVQRIERSISGRDKDSFTYLIDEATGLCFAFYGGNQRGGLTSIRCDAVLPLLKQ